MRERDYVRRAADLSILAVWVVCCGLTIDLVVFPSPFPLLRATLLLPLFAGAGLGGYWRGRRP